jgi:dihydrofolate reductase
MAEPGDSLRKVIFQMMVSLDGYFEGPNREIDWHVVDGEFNDYADEFLRSVDILVFGRVTYQLMAGYWPTPDAIKNDPIIAERMNSLSKIVFSRTLQKVEWQNTRLVKGDVAREIAKLKQQPGKNIAIFGSSDLTVSLIELGLIDEYRIMVNPVVLGHGKPLFKGITNRLNLKLIGVRTFGSGVVTLTYRPPVENEGDV